MKKIGFLFGAGAEVDYGLPLGGEFALNIFKEDSSESKKEFKEMREKIIKSSNYAAKWLPQKFTAKNVNSFGRGVYNTIIKDTIDHNRDKIIKKINRFDQIAKKELDKLTEKYNDKDKNEEFQQIVLKVTGVNLYNNNLTHSLQFTDEFKEGNDLFKNIYFGGLIEIYKNKDFLEKTYKNELRKILSSMFQLLLGALSDKLARKVSENIFETNDLELDFFDDLGNNLLIDYNTSGVQGLEFLTENKDFKSETNQELVIELSRNIMINIYSSVLDYKSLIDTYWHYLYCPKQEWSKFCKISIFLITVKNYILSFLNGDEKENEEGYYNELQKALTSDEKKFEATLIATSNYNTLIEEVMKDQEITFLNGGTNTYYDPYLNQINTKEYFEKQGEKHFIVPLLFTQSGTKPMTSIDMSLKYVDLYHKYKDSDFICTIGFGFNADDEHINGIIRTLIERENKKLVIIDIDQEPEDERRKTIAEKLKISKPENLLFITVDKFHRQNEIHWIDKLREF